MPYPCWRANGLENKHGSIVGVFLFINMFRWSLVNYHWDACYCWVHQHQRDKASIQCKQGLETGWKHNVAIKVLI